jgi:hypothetical protein
MAEYIEREALREAFIKHFDAVYDDGKLVFSDHICTAEDCEDILKLVAELPTADVVPVEWISVKDRLPETNGKYLCANYSKTFNRYFIEVLSFAKDLHKVDEFDFKEEKGKSGFYMYDSEWGYSRFRNVTHWMPLPEPPKKEGVDNG